MGGKQAFKIKILFVLIILFLSGCAVSPKQEPPRKNVLADVLVFHDLREVDLDKDGVKEIVAIYSTRSNTSGVKVIKFRNGNGEVIFERIFNTLDVKFEMKNNVFSLIVGETAQPAGYAAHGMKSVYRWDGNAFTFAGKE